MKFLVVFLAFVAGAVAQLRQPLPNRQTVPPRPPPPPSQQQDRPIAIIRQTAEIQGDGSYRWAYETENGIAASEQGEPRVQGPEGPAVAATGQFAYTADDGTPIQLTYVADENGFQPQGPHLPTPPPIPEEILRGLEYNAAHPEEDNL